MHDSDESADYESNSKDDLRSVSGFEGADSNETQGNDVSHSDHTSEIRMLPLNSTSPALVSTALKEQLLGLLLDTLKV
uniref:Uncharacterized protein n=1 Tax=Tanacetum cinerariifolium TaxID=118510 RepID=A0A699V301_TANCI|nr:hypothetical protein [Tanacetum cinerariifolium]